MREYLREGRELAKMRWWCIRKHEQDWSGDKIAAHLGIPRKNALKQPLAGRFQAYGKR